MITIHAMPGKHGGPDRARCEIAGRAFVAKSRAGSIPALCRVLVAAGIPDQPWQMINDAYPGIVSLTGDSIRKMATIDYKAGMGGYRRGRHVETCPSASPISAGQSAGRVVA